MKKILILFCINFFVAKYSVAQLENSNWYFGDSAGVKFTTSGIIPLTDGVMRSIEGCAAISDSIGNILFYSNSQTIWNSNDDTMENGFGILPHFIDGFDLTSWYSQGALILPKPEHSKIFYLLSLVSKKDSTLILSEIDMNLNGGLGKVIMKNRFIYMDSLAEGMTAIKHGNGRDYWVICHELKTSRFIKFLLTPDTLFGPFFQNFGNALDSQFYESSTQCVFSPDGSKYAIANINGICKLFSFDRCTGIFTDFIELSSPPYPPDFMDEIYGCSFSPDSKKLYVSSYSKLFQYDIDSPNILVTKDTVWESIDLDYGLGAHQLGSDNKIYITYSYLANPSSVFSIHNTHLSVIDQPNFNSCQFILDTISLAGKRTFYGLPNTINYSLGKLSGSACDTLTSIQNENLKTKSVVTISPNPATTEIKITNLSPTENQISLFNLLGQQVKSIRVSHVQSTILPVSDLPAGIYVVTIFDGEKIVCKKFVKE